MLCEGHCDSFEREFADPSDAARLQADREANIAAVVAVQKGVVVALWYWLSVESALIVHN